MPTVSVYAQYPELLLVAIHQITAHAQTLVNVAVVLL